VKEREILRQRCVIEGEDCDVCVCMYMHNHVCVIEGEDCDVYVCMYMHNHVCVCICIIM